MNNSPSYLFRVLTSWYRQSWRESTVGWLVCGALIVLIQLAVSMAQEHISTFVHGGQGKQSPTSSFRWATRQNVFSRQMRADQTMDLPEEKVLKTTVPFVDYSYDSNGNFVQATFPWWSYLRHHERDFLHADSLSEVAYGMPMDMVHLISIDFIQNRPVRPLQKIYYINWFGAAFNLLCWSTISCLLTLFCFAMIVQARIRKGNCARCNYELAGSCQSMCPECGYKKPQTMH